MHRSRIGVTLIDHPSATYDSGATFWGGVVGRQPVPLADDEPYANLGTLDGIELAMQHLDSDTAARVHLDVETDDVEAEVKRLCALGATVTERRDGYAILADPGGLVFCVVPVQSAEQFERSARSWK
jgi:hypothetical protein